MKKLIPLSVPNFIGNELKYVTDAVKSEWVSTGGSYINDLENNIAIYLKVQETVACQSGTAALHLALKLSQVGVQDEVIVPTLTFIAAVNPVKYLGAEPIFMDCDDSLNIDLDKLQTFLKEETVLIGGACINKNTRNQIKAIVVVHVFGNLINMEKVMDIAKEFNLKVIEDATEALGSYYTSGKYIGRFAGTIGDFGAYSFNGNKIITTGGGGILVATDGELLSKAKYLSTQAKDDELYYMHGDIGFNYRMTNLQAALGVAQMENLEGFISIKERNYYLYKEGLKEVNGLNFIKFNENSRPNYWFYSLVIDRKLFGISRDEMITKLQARGIQTRPVWGLIHMQKPYNGAQSYNIEKAIYYQDNLINVPCSTNLTEQDLKYVIECIKYLKNG